MMEPPDSNEKTAAHVPIAGRAAVSDDKLAMYLMNPAHVLGGPACRFLMGFGFRQSHLETLRAALLGDVREHAATFDEETEYGGKWVVRGPLRSPDGRDPDISSVWQIDHGASAPKFVTITDLDKEKP